MRWKSPMWAERAKVEKADETGQTPADVELRSWLERRFSLPILKVDCAGSTTTLSHTVYYQRESGVC